jgi:hypothetical protein
MGDSRILVSAARAAVSTGTKAPIRRQRHSQTRAGSRHWRWLWLWLWLWLSGTASLMLQRQPSPLCCAVLRRAVPCCVALPLFISALCISKHCRRPLRYCRRLTPNAACPASAPTALSLPRRPFPPRSLKPHPLSIYQHHPYPSPLQSHHPLPMAPAPFRASLCPLPHPASFADITPSPLPSSFHPLHLHLDLTRKHSPLATPLYYAPLLCNPISCSLANRVSLEQNINAMPSEKVRLSHVDVIRAPSRLETAPST